LLALKTMAAATIFKNRSGVNLIKLLHVSFTSVLNHCLESDNNSYTLMAPDVVLKNIDRVHCIVVGFQEGQERSAQTYI